MKRTILKLLKQKTTWIGIVGLLSLLGVKISPEMSKEIISVGVIIASSLLAVFDEEKSSK